MEGCDGYTVCDEERMLTRAVSPIACEATETEAEVTPHSVLTLGKLTALLLPCLTLIHIWEERERVGRWEREGERIR